MLWSESQSQSRCGFSSSGAPTIHPTPPMKSSPLLMIAGAVALLLIPPFASDLYANFSTPQSPLSLEISPEDYPLGRDCVITLDPQHTSTPVFAGGANINTGFAAPDVIRGIIIREQAHWLIVKCGRYENWVPKSKILMISVWD